MCSKSINFFSHDITGQKIKKCLTFLVFKCIQKVSTFSLHYKNGKIQEKCLRFNCLKVFKKVSK